MKWSKKTARALALGASITEPALKGRPKGSEFATLLARCSKDFRPFLLCSLAVGINTREQLTSIRRSGPFRAFPVWGAFPGLKPWAVL
jgi:hypothetical protein